MSADQGVVFLVGTGPGDPGLITVAGRKLRESGDAKESTTDGLVAAVELALT